MTKILIVDDEITIRNGLTFSMPWEENGFTVAGSAKNGMEALELFQHSDVDIIVSDIKMPQMDGIELLKSIHTQHPHVPFIFISGYDEFEFAQKAINNGAFAYLLKPIDIDELMTILIRAREYLIESNTTEGSLGSLITRNLFSLDSLDITGYERLYTSYVDYHFCIVNLRLQSGSFSTDSTQIIQFLNNAQKLVALLLDKNYALLEATPQGLALCLYSSNESELKEAVLSFTNKLYQNLSEQYQITFAIGLSVIRKGLSSVSLSYMESFNEDAFFLKSGTTKSNMKSNIFNYDEYSSIFSYQESIVALLLSGDFTGAWEALSSLQKHIRELSLSFEDMKLFCRNLLYSYLYALIESGIPEKTFSAFDISSLFNSESIPEMFEQLYTLLQETCKHPSLLQHKNIDKLILQAKQYISNHYFEPSLSMPEVADFVGLNPSYFSAEFARHENLCFINYLTHFRITKSKRLLTCTDDKIQIVSEAVGYMNATYYSTIFKRSEGVTPSQYRKNCTNVK